VPSANYTKINGPFLGTNFNSQLPNGHLAVGHLSTASWNAFCNLWFVKPIACTSRFQFDDMQSVLRAWHHLAWYVLLGICWSNIFKFPAVWPKLSFFQVHLWKPGLVHASVGALALGCLRESSNNSWELRVKKDCYRLLDKNGFDRGGHLQNYIDCGGRYWCGYFVCITL
jgi:hypothetical protein